MVWAEWNKCNPIRYRFRNCKVRARIKGIEFSLTFEQFKKEAVKPCYYCGGVFGFVKRCGGLDRVDNSQGYIESNVVSCCQVCNRVKGDFFTKEETLLMIRAVLNFKNRLRVAPD